MQPVDQEFASANTSSRSISHAIPLPKTSTVSTFTGIFHGWWMVIVSGLGLFLGPIPVVVFSFGVFLEPLAQEFQSGRATIAFALSLYSTILACSLPFAGKLIDRFGAFRVILPSTFATGVVLIAACLCGESVGQLYLFYAALGVASCGISPVSYCDVVLHWFDYRRGLAIGLTMLGLGAGAVIVPSLTQRFIERFGWRLTFALFGAAILAITLPVLFVFLKDRPGSKGLLAHGALYPTATSQPSTAKIGLTWHKARRTRTFWSLFCATVLVSAGTQACLAHLASILADRGSPAQKAAFATSLFGGGLLVGRTATGYLLDRFFAPRVAAIIFAGAAVGVALLRINGAEGLAFVAAFVIGLGLGSEGDIMAYLTGRYFGLRAFGAIYGITFAGFGFAAGLGPFLMGAAFDVTGSYRGSLAVNCILILIGAALMASLGPYRCHNMLSSDS